MEVQEALDGGAGRRARRRTRRAAPRASAGGSCERYAAEEAAIVGRFGGVGPARGRGRARRALLEWFKQRLADPRLPAHGHRRPRATRWERTRRRMSRIVGIDLGTTNSLVAYVDGGVPRVIPDAEGTRPAALDRGVHARRRARGRGGAPAARPATRRARSTRSSGSWGAATTTSKDELALLPVRGGAGGRGGAHPGRRARGDAARGLGPRAPGAQAAGRGALRRAGRAGGDHRARVLQRRPAPGDQGRRAASPGSRCCASSTSRPRPRSPTGCSSSPQGVIAVYDLGGGTFDISILRVKDGVFEVLATNGNTHLGGDDFDRAMVDWLLADIRERHGVDLSGDAEALQELRLGAEAAKCRLSFDERTALTIPFEGFTYRRDIARAEVEAPDRAARRAARSARAGMALARRRASAPTRSTRSCWSAARPGCRWCGARVEELFGRTPAQPAEPRRGGGARRGGAGPDPGRRHHRHAAARRDAAVARHRDPGRHRERAHRAQHDDPDHGQGDVHDVGGRPDRRGPARAPGRARAGQGQPLARALRAAGIDPMPGGHAEDRGDLPDRRQRHPAGAGARAPHRQGGARSRCGRRTASPRPRSSAWSRSRSSTRRPTSRPGCSSRPRPRPTP